MSQEEKMRRCIDKKRGRQVGDGHHIKIYPAKTQGTEKCPRCGLWIKKQMGVS